MEAGKTSQDVIDDFWKSVIAEEKTQTKASAVLPPNVYTQLVGRRVPRGVTTAESVEASYLAARKDCEKKVAQVVKECRMVNQKYSDPYFDLTERQHCLTPLSIVNEANADDPPDPTPTVAPPPLPCPPSVKRVGDVFDDPHFFVDGPSAKDIRQGGDGDCWFLSALMAICNLDLTVSLVSKICVAWDQDVGVYGFVLYRDGEWTSVIVDDKLYLRKPDYEDADEQTRGEWEDNRNRINSEDEYRREFQSNSRALYYAQSTNPNETWVPLIEKAFAKAHGDYGVIESGSVGDGVEDLTGGVSTTILTADILNKDSFWNDCLLQVNKEFLFGCGTQDWDDPLGKGRDGIHGGHAYSILQAVNYGKERLLMMKNPWSQSEWNGPWSDGSSQWTAESIKDLGHTFGDDGIFWIRYEDMLRKYDVIWKTRLFRPDWRVTQQWTSLNIPWAGEYQDTKFEVVVEKPAPTVFVLSQLDDRYFRGLTGQYDFMLSFRVHRAGEEDYILRTFGEWIGQRSISAELDLEAGTYEIRLKISAYRDDDADKVEDVVKFNWLDRRAKLLQVGLSYDLAHAKAQLGPKHKEESKQKPKPAPAPGAVTTTEVPASDAPVPKTELEGGDSSSAAQVGFPRGPELAKGSYNYVNGPRIRYFENYGSDYNGSVNGDPEPTKGAVASKAEGDQKKNAPWGAVCVVGLRVYCRNADATIQIVRPVEEEVKATDSMDAVRLVKPDVDDPACDAVNGAENEKEDEKKDGGLEKGENKGEKV